MKTNKTISDEKLKELKYNAFNILSDVRRQLINDYPFIGSIAMAMDIVPIRDIRVPTACTDGTTIYFDIDFLSKLKNDERLFVFAHEVWHAALCHMTRKECREAELFNISADLEVNQLLTNDGFIRLKGCCYPDVFNVPKDLSAEQYYELLLNDMKKNMPKMSALDSHVYQNEENQTGKKQSNKSGNDKEENSKSDKKDKSSGSKDNNKSKDKASDKNESSSDNQGNGSDGGLESESGYGSRSDKYGKVGFDSDFNPKVKANIESEMRSNVSIAAQQYERTRGELPGHLQRIVNEILKPKINWKEELQKFVTKTIDNKVNWSLPNHRYASRGIYLPSLDGDKIKLGVIIDTSGSTIGDMKNFLSELNGIVTSFSNYEVTVIQCDASVGSVKTYNLENPLNLLDESFEITGGGGTSMTPAFEYFQEHEGEEGFDVDGIVVFTDGYIDDVDPDLCKVPTMWILPKDGSTDVITFGSVVWMKDV